MLGKELLRQWAEKALSHSQADQTEVVIVAQESQLTRFANSTIHQNVSEWDVEIRVRAVLGKRYGVATTNILSQESIERAVDTAIDIARRQPEHPDFHSLPEPQPIPTIDAFDEAVARCSPEERARGVGVICRQAQDAGLTAAGAFETTTMEIAVVNSLGVFAYHPLTQADLQTVIMGEDSSGWAQQTAWRLDNVHPEVVGAEAVERALRGRHPRDLEPGVYPVVLEEYAVQDILHMFSYLGFGARAVQEGRSFMAGRFGERLVDPRISIWDDGLDIHGLPLPFDFEGVPRRRVDLIKEGVAVGVVYDTLTAAREGKRSTGHALPAPNPMGPIPGHLVMAPGDTTKEAMIQNLDYGILVTRFWYTRPVHPKETIITGMTRDGTFVIKNGEIAYPVRNLRFTQNYLEALNHVIAVGNSLKRLRGMLAVDRMPALCLGEFAFTGATVD